MSEPVEPKALLRRKLLDISYRRGSTFRYDVTDKSDSRVTVTVKRFGPTEDWPKGDAFVSVSSGGEQVAIDERHLDRVIVALQKARDELRRTA